VQGGVKCEAVRATGPERGEEFGVLRAGRRWRHLEEAGNTGRAKRGGYGEPPLEERGEGETL